MKAEDLAKAQELVAKRAENERLRAKLAGGARLRLMAGEGNDTDEIVLASAFLEGLRGDLIKGLGLRSAALGAQLEALGVEP